MERLLRDCTEKVPDLAAVRKCFTSFETKRGARSKPVVEVTNRHVRLFTYSNPFFKFMWRYGQPCMGDASANSANSRHVGAERVDFLPVPPRSVSGTMMFNPTQGVGLFESLLNRALLAIPLLLVGFLGSQLTEQKLLNTVPLLMGYSRSSNVSNSSSAAVLKQTPSNDEWSHTWSSDALNLVYWYKLRLFLVDVAPIYLIWLMEANRRANHMKPVQL